MATTDPQGGSDREVVRLCRQGSEAGFRTMLGKHHRFVFALCWRLIGNREEALDVTQEVFLRVSQSVHRLNPNPSLRPWLRRVATNLCLNLLNSRYWRDAKQDAADPATSREGSPGGGAVGGALDPVGEAAATSDELRRVNEAIKRLPPRQRAVLILKVVEGLSYAEIGRVLALPTGTVKSHLSRARAGLRKTLAAEGLEAAQ